MKIKIRDCGKPVIEAEVPEGYLPFPDGSVVDISMLLDKYNKLDAAQSDTMFRLAAAIMQYKAINKLSMKTAARLMPFIAARTQAAEISLAQNKKTLGHASEVMGFLNEYRDSMMKLQSDSTLSVDETVSALIDKLPSERAMRSKAGNAPQIKAVMDNFRSLASTCSDGSISERFEEYYTKIYGV